MRAAGVRKKIIVLAMVALAVLHGFSMWLRLLSVTGMRGWRSWRRNGTRIVLWTMGLVVKILETALIRRNKTSIPR
jgi:hypothetical protein